jgi:hypothetical protein
VDSDRGRAAHHVVDLLGAHCGGSTEGERRKAQKQTRHIGEKADGGKGEAEREEEVKGIIKREGAGIRAIHERGGGERAAIAAGTRRTACAPRHSSTATAGHRRAGSKRIRSGPNSESSYHILNSQRTTENPFTCKQLIKEI